MFLNHQNANVYLTTTTTTTMMKLCFFQRPKMLVWWWSIIILFYCQNLPRPIVSNTAKTHISHREYKLIVNAVWNDRCEWMWMLVEEKRKITVNSPLTALRNAVGIEQRGDCWICNRWVGDWGRQDCRGLNGDHPDLVMIGGLVLTRFCTSPVRREKLN